MTFSGHDDSTINIVLGLLLLLLLLSAVQKKLHGQALLVTYNDIILETWSKA